MLRGKAFQIASNPTYNDYQRGLASMVYKFLIKNLQVVAGGGRLHFQINLQLISKYNKGIRCLLGMYWSF